MPVQNSNFKMSAHPDLDTYLVCHNMYSRYVPEDGLLGKYLVFTTQKSKLKNLHRNFCLSKKVFRKLPVQKTDRTGPSY